MKTRLIGAIALAAGVAVAVRVTRLADDVARVAPDFGAVALTNSKAFSEMMPGQGNSSLSSSELDWAPELKAKLADIINSGEASDLLSLRLDLAQHAERIGRESSYVDRIRGADYGLSLEHLFQNKRLVMDFFAMFDSEESNEILGVRMTELGRKYPMARQHLATCEALLVHRKDRISERASQLSIELGGAPEDHMEQAREEWAMFRRATQKEVSQNDDEVG